MTRRLFRMLATLAVVSMPVIGASSSASAQTDVVTVPATTAPASTAAPAGPATTATGDTTLGLGHDSGRHRRDDGSTPTGWIVVGVLAFVAIAVAAILAARRRR